MTPRSVRTTLSPAFVGIVLAVVPCVELSMRRIAHRVPARPAFATLLAANSALLGVALVSQELAPTFIRALLLSFAAAGTFAFLLLAAATLHERLRYADVPAPFRDAPIALITTGLIALGFMGFMGLVPE
jgi:electron transport complex protein RnfA